MPVGPPPQELRIDYEYDPYAPTEQVRYEPGRLADDTEPDSVEHRTKLDMIIARLEALRTTVQRLVGLACDGRRRGSCGVETSVDDLAKALLREEGFTELAAPRVDVLLRARGVLAGIPWEMIEERYFECPGPPLHDPVRFRDPRPDDAERHCSECGKEMTLVREKLGIARIISHAVRPSEPRKQPARGHFVVIADPVEDLCRPCNDPQGIAARNTEQLVKLLRRHFQVSCLSGKTATVGVVRSAIAADDVVGIYYFGHGVVPIGGGEGSLVLAGKTPLYAREILDCKPSAPFVFLNACVSAVNNGNWTIDRKFDSVTHAFAKGVAKTCIGTLWQIVNTQATGAALEFFRLMLDKGQSAAEALRAIRKRSLERYRDGDEPDTVWMSYRLFTRDLSYRLAPPHEPHEPPAVGPVAPPPPAQTPPLFDGRVLDLGAFAFPARPVLHRAATRRNGQRRARVSLEDFVAGLLAKGLLTRKLCANASQDPDALRDRLCGADLGPDDPIIEEPASDGGPPRENLRLASSARGPRPFEAREVGDFHPGLLDLFTRACRLEDVNAAGARAGFQVSERDLLLALLGDEPGPASWPRTLAPFLPSAPESRRFLHEAIGREIDENGALTFDDLDPGARRVVVHAHELAVQRGRCPIPNRLLLAALFENDERWAWQACEARPDLGVRPFLLRELMIASVDPRRHDDFLLSEEACERIVTPAVGLARQWAAAQGLDEVDEPTLFRAFVHETTPALKDALENLDQPIRLDELGHALPTDTTTPPLPGVTEDLPGLSDGARALIAVAEEWAEAQGARDLRCAHLFAALVGDGLTPLGQALRQQGADPQQVKRQILSRSGPGGPAPGAATPSRARPVEQILTRAVALAECEGRRCADCEHVLRAFFAADNGGVAEQLRQLGLEPPALPPARV